jgi:ribonuclease Z
MQAPTSARWPLRGGGAAARPGAAAALKRPPSLAAAAGTGAGSSSSAARRLGNPQQQQQQQQQQQRSRPPQQQQDQQHPHHRQYHHNAGRSWQGASGAPPPRSRSRSRSRSRGGRRRPMSPAAAPPTLQLPPSAAPRLPEAVDWAALPTGLAVTWLGTSSGAPSLHRNISCTVLRHRPAARAGAGRASSSSPPPPPNTFIVDAGEGSARQLSRTGVDLSGTRAVLVTHLHGDHCFGLGSLVAACLSARRAAAAAAGGAPHATADSPLLVVGPPGVHDLIAAQLLATGLMRSLLLPEQESPPSPLLRVVELVELPGDGAQASPASEWRKHRAACALAGAAASSAVLLERLPPQRGDAPDAELRARLRGSSLVPPEQRRMYQHHHHHHHAPPPPPAAAAPQPGNLDADAGNGARPPPYTAKPGLVWPLPLPAGCGAHVAAAQLQHRVPCWGYVWEELVEEEEEVKGRSRQRGLLQSRGASSAQRGRKVVLLGDTVDSAALAPLALGADLIAHEATFARGMEGKAALAQHSTARMAGSFARAVGARRLVLTHFSARYDQAAVGGGGGGPGAGVPGAGGQGGSGAPPPAGQDDEERAQRVAIDALRLEAAQAMVGGGGGGAGSGRPRLARVEAAHDFWTAHVAAVEDEEGEEDEYMDEPPRGSMR